MFYFMPFTKRLERSGRALPCPVPWGSFCRFTFLSLWLFGVLSQSQQKRGVFMNNQDIPLGWAHVLVGWMRFPSDVINFILLLLLFRHSVVSSSLWPHGLQHTRLPLSFTISQSLLKLMSVESVMPSNHLILCRPLLLLPSIFPSIRVFSNESVLHIKWPKLVTGDTKSRNLMCTLVQWSDLSHCKIWR